MNINAFGLVGIAFATVVGLVAAVPARTAPETVPVAETVTLSPAWFVHPRPGEFLFADGTRTSAPRLRIRIDRPLEIMLYQVSVGEYERCVAANACEASGGRGPNNVPVTGVSYLDAEAYARWYSRVTGQHWRLPTDSEWAYAARERFYPDIEPTVDDPANPARAWLSSYQREVSLGRKPDPKPRMRGSFGENSNGIADLAGNIWEWTSTCYARVTLFRGNGGIENQVENCGVRVVEGFHRTYMSNFIRDGKSGGCAVGLPPDNLGFRLVRERELVERTLRVFGTGTMPV